MANGPPQTQRTLIAKQNARQRAQQKKAIPLQSQNQITQQTISPKEQFRRQLIQEYGSKVGGELFQIAGLEAELEKVKGQPGMQKREKQLQLTLAGARQSLREGEGPIRTPSGQGITTTITRLSGAKEVFSQGKVTVISPPQQVPASGPGVSTAQGEKLFSPQTRLQQNVLASFQPEKSNGVIKGFPATGKQFGGQPISTPQGIGEQFPISRKDQKASIIIEKKEKPEVSLRKSGIADFTSKTIAEGISLSGKAFELGFFPTATLIKYPFETKEVFEKRKGIQRLVVEETFQSGSYFVPFFGTTRSVVDVGAQFETGKADSVFSSLAIGAGLFGATKILGKGFSAAQPILKKIPGSTTLIRSVELSFPAFVLGSTALSLSDKTQRISTEGLPSLEKEIQLEARETGGVVLGFSGAQRASNIAKEVSFLVRGKKPLDASVITDPKVLSGEKTFPLVEGGVGPGLRAFQKDVGPFKGPGGFSATRTNISGKSLVDREKIKSEVTGLYAAPTLSPFFLRIEGGGSEVKGFSFIPNLLEAAGSPLVLRIRAPTDRIPGNVLKEFRKVRGGQKKGGKQTTQQQFANLLFEDLSRTRRGTMFTTPQFEFGKPETEVALPAGNILLENNFRFFTKVKGEVVPIREFVTEKGVSGLSKALQKNTVENLSVGVSSFEYRVSSSSFRPISPVRGSSIENRTTKSSSVTRLIENRSVGSSLRENAISQSRGGPESVSRIVSGSESFRESFEPRIVRRNFIVPSRPPPSILESSGGGSSSQPRLFPPRPPTRTTIRRPSFIPPIPPRSPPRQLYQYKYPRGLGSLIGPGFKVITRKGGKEVKLPGVFTREDALAFGQNVVSKTLRASFRVEKTGGSAIQKGITVSNLGFTRSKRDPRFLVEPRSQRLSTRSEVREIQSARSNKILRGLL